MSSQESIAPVQTAPPPLAPAVQQALRVLMDALRLPAPPLPKMSYDEFLNWANEDTLAEWVNGEVIITSPASKTHQILVGFLHIILSEFAEANHLGQVLAAPFQMKLQHSGREPDVLFVARAHLDRLEENYLDGPADLAIEIISPESASRDRGEKFYEYEVAGLPEYWLIDPQRQRAEFYLLEGNRYRLAYEGDKGEYRARVLPGFWLKVEWLWQEPLPSTITILRELGLI